MEKLDFTRNSSIFHKDALVQVPLKIILSAVFVLTFVFSSGCTSPGYTQTPTGKQIEIFRDGAKPSRDFREIGMLTDDGGLGEQGEIEGKFLKHARKAGADAKILHTATKTGGELKGFQIVETYLFKATLIVYSAK